MPNKSRRKSRYNARTNHRRACGLRKYGTNAQRKKQYNYEHRLKQKLRQELKEEIDQDIARRISISNDHYKEENEFLRNVIVNECINAEIDDIQMKDDEFDPPREPPRDISHIDKIKLLNLCKMVGYDNLENVVSLAQSLPSNMKL